MIEDKHLALEVLLTNADGTVNMTAYRELESSIIALNADTHDSITYKHELLEGLYVRTISAKAGAILVGDKTRTATSIYVEKGALVVWQTDGTTKLVAEGDFFVSRAAVGRICFVLEDCSWVNTYPRLGDTVEEIENNIYCNPNKLHSRRVR